MASDVVYEAIKDHLTAQWGTTTPVMWENEDFEKPQPPAPWIAVELTGTLYAQQSIGAGDEQEENRWDEDGILWLLVYVPTGSGSTTARRYAKQLADLFRGALLLDDDLEFQDASIGAGQTGEDDGSYYMIAVSIDWRRMEA